MIYYVIPLIASAIMTESYFLWQDSINRYWEYGYQASFGDALMYVFKGIREFHPNVDTEFRVPVAYLTVAIIVTLFIGGRALKDLSGYGLNRLLRYESRARWWLGKCLWNAGCIIRIYLALFAGVIMVCLIHIKDMDSAGWLGIHGDIINRMFEGEAEGEPDVRLLMVMILVLPFLTSMAVSMCQMVLDFFTQPAVSFICVMAVYITSVFYMNGYMPGNYAMVFRYNQINPDGVQLMTGVVFNVAVIVAAVVAGYIRFRKYNILGGRV